MFQVPQKCLYLSVKLYGISWQKIACKLHLKSHLEDISIAGSISCNNLGIPCAVTVIPTSSFYTSMLLIMQIYA